MHLRYAVSLGVFHTVVCTANNSYHNALYFTNWSVYQRQFYPSDIPADDVTFLYYAFANIDEDGRVFSADLDADLLRPFTNLCGPQLSLETAANGCVGEIAKLKRENRNMKVLLSVGGWSYSSIFPIATDTSEKRTNFARTAVDLITSWGFDGLDIDWEYPGTQVEARNYFDLLRTIRSQLDNYSKQHSPDYKLLLTIASPAGPEHYTKLLLTEMESTLDYFNLMAYDYSGEWSDVTSHQANIFKSISRPETTPFSTDEAIQYYLDQGVPPDKILLGLPLYGRSFSQTKGLGTPFIPATEGSWENGIWDASALALAGSQVYFEDETIASYSYNQMTNSLTSYDSPEVVEEKVAYVKTLGLGGVFFWEASGDATSDQSTVRSTASFFRAGSGLKRSINLLHYPNSEYSNIRA